MPMPKGKPKDQSVKARALHRLKIARGHMEKVVRMLEDDDYCIDVVHQSLAVSAALRKVNEMILENHMKTCVADSIREGNQKEVIDEVMAVMKRS